jgi:hypothetical protein
VRQLGGHWRAHEDVGANVDVRDGVIHDHHRRLTTKTGTFFRV